MTDGAPITAEPVTRLLGRDDRGRTHVSMAAATHRGGVREHNEDSVLVGGWTACGAPSASLSGRLPAEGALILAVADGLGGHAGGEVASRLVVEFLAQATDRLADERAAVSVLREADAMLAAEGLRSPGLRDMGSTVAGVALVGNQLVIFTVGDSSVWGVFDDRMRLLSRRDRPARPPGASDDAAVTALTQCLGGGSRGVHPHVLAVEIAAGDRYVIATDGLTDLIDPGELLQGSQRPMAEAADVLVESALRAGGHDNISVIVVEA